MPKSKNVEEQYKVILDMSLEFKKFKESNKIWVKHIALHFGLDLMFNKSIARPRRRSWVKTDYKPIYDNRKTFI